MKINRSIALTAAFLLLMPTVVSAVTLNEYEYAVHGQVSSDISVPGNNALGGAFLENAFNLDSSESDVTLKYRTMGTADIADDVVIVSGTVPGYLYSERGTVSEYQGRPKQSPGGARGKFDATIQLRFTDLEGTGPDNRSVAAGDGKPGERERVGTLTALNLWEGYGSDSIPIFMKNDKDFAFRINDQKGLGWLELQGIKGSFFSGVARAEAGAVRFNSQANWAMSIESLFNGTPMVPPSMTNPPTDTEVPEPATLTLLGCSLLGLGFKKRNTKS